MLLYSVLVIYREHSSVRPLPMCANCDGINGFT
jgi:hypothetical protein